MSEMTTKQKTIRAHNAGPNMPLLTHEEYVQYLWECAEKWEPIDAAQHKIVSSKAQGHDRYPERCEVCKRHGLLEG